MPEQPGAPNINLRVTGSRFVAQSGTGPATLHVEFPSAPPIDYTAEMRQDVAYALAQLRSRNVLFSEIDNEIWKYVFSSLRNLRNFLSKTSAQLHIYGPRDIRSAIEFMSDVISIYLSEYEAGLEKFMGKGGWDSYKESDWLLAQKGRPANDLIKLRGILKSVTTNLSRYADSGEAVEWKEPRMAEYWSKWVRQRRGGS